MAKVFIINGGQVFDESKGLFNKLLAEWTGDFLEENGFEVRITNTGDDFDIQQEVENFTWADVIVVHTPIWWFQVPYKLKQYVDLVFQNGRGKIYKSDGRSRTNPEINYGTGGLLQGKQYMITSSWNAPEGAFTLKDELMGQTAVDTGVLFGFHIAMKFVGLTKLEGFHFYDIVKGLTPKRFEAYHNNYIAHLKRTFEPLKK
ncbi:NAD(P)H-dependent oxidoreductase [Algoriphagus sp. AGSA1]|uniref:NAD(P)H-dependent oxidoreductase n=1 Tax=Algoriphagus sp. AGSA1 TaxID=2907213 RepID=UPI001F3BFEB7|nr:NAD(P)H-dependent oxidoreductase [Algoriphagus sp. AGSA1]MCE7054695.1 NAD(P)H-dependent oxidoreductase [Algoriphagus sp. AGSA1]